MVGTWLLQRGPVSQGISRPVRVGASMLQQASSHVIQPFVVALHVGATRQLPLPAQHRAAAGTAGCCCRIRRTTTNCVGGHHCVCTGKLVIAIGFIRAPKQHGRKQHVPPAPCKAVARVPQRHSRISFRSQCRSIKQLLLRGVYPTAARLVVGAALLLVTSPACLAPLGSAAFLFPQPKPLTDPRIHNEENFTPKS